MEKIINKYLVFFLFKIFLLTIFLSFTAVNAAQTTTTKASATNTAVIRNILISDKANKEGYVTTGKTSLPTSPSRIYVSVLVSKATPGLKVSIVLTSPQNHQADLTSEVTQTGNILKGFIFESNMTPWSSGVYHVDVSLSSGGKQSTTFTVK